MLLADDAAVTTHTKQELQALMGRLSQACKDFGLTISLKKTNVLGQDTMELPAITIDDYELVLLNSSHILAPPLSTTSPWTLRSIRGLGRLQFRLQYFSLVRSHSYWSSTECRLKPYAIFQDRQLHAHWAVGHLRVETRQTLEQVSTLTCDAKSKESTVQF